MEALTPYETYRESGSRWIGRIPAHWDVHRLGAQLSLRTERNRPELPLLSVAREKGVFVRSLEEDEENHNVIPDDLRNYKVARSGDLVINKMKAWQGSMGIAPCDGIVSPAYYVFKLSIENRAFVQRLFRSRPYVAHFGQASDGVRIGQWDLSIPGLREIPTIIPPPEEQTAVVRYLDWACGRLDRVIRAKRKSIALLNEQKQTIIHRAVMSGLDRNVPRRGAGLSWLKEIPSHWRTVRNLGLFSNRVERGRENLPILQVSIRAGITFDETDQFGRPKRLIADVSKYKLIRHSDLAYNTMRMWQGAVGVSPADGLVSPAYVVIQPRQGTNPYFYNYVFRTSAYMDQVNRYSTGIVSDRNRLYWESFKQMPNLAPPPEEQEAIVQFIRGETASLDREIDRIDRAIGLIREYRARLIADAVTGKLDVREAAAKLPHEVAEPSVSETDELELDDEEMAAAVDIEG